MTLEEKDSENQKSEPVKVEEPQKEVKPELSRRDALEVALEVVRDEAESKTKPKEEIAATARKSASASDHAPIDKGNSGVVSEEQAPPALSPPAEWNKEEKAAFLELSPKAQEAALRLEKSRRSKVAEIKAATREYDDVKAMAEMVRPYLKAVGHKESTEVALKKALAMWREFEEGDPKAAAAAYLKAKGIDIPKELLGDGKQNDRSDEKINPLQKEISEIKEKLERQEHATKAATLMEAWKPFEEEKNAVGKLKHPDLDNSEQGLELAKNIGSLVGGQTELSKQFITFVKNRYPDAGYSTLLKEAYKYLGGRVDDSDAPRTQNTQAHIVKSSRAASSVPGRGSSVQASAPVKKFKDRREALRYAIEVSQDN